MQPSPDTIAQIAGEALRSRRDQARQTVRNGGMHPAEAERRLAPWAAIACLAGVDLPEFTEPLADLTCRDDSADEAHTFTEAQARALLAERICPRERWVRTLAAARDRALDRAEASAASARMPRDQVEADAAAARALRALAEAFEFDSRGRHPVPPYRPSTPALENAA